jgi:membrane protein YdbS with pleckstrin-like domain
MMRPPRGEEEYLRFPVWMQALVVVLLAAVLAVAVVSVVDGWADWVVLGGILVAVFGMMVAVNRRQYPTRKRSFTKDSDSQW